MDRPRTPCPGASRTGGDADNSLHLGTGARRVCRQILLCNSHLCIAFPRVQPALRTSQASPPCTAAPLPRKAQSKNEKQLKIQHDNQAALQSRQHPPAHPAPEQDQTSAIQPSAAQLQPSSPGNLQQAGQGNPMQQLTKRIAQVEDRPLSLPACLARWLLEEEERGGGGQRAKRTPLRGMSQLTLITWNSSQRRPGRRKYGQQMEMLKALK